MVDLLRCKIGIVGVVNAHATTEVIEDAILKEISPADVTIHVEPAGASKPSGKKLKRKIKELNLISKKAERNSYHPSC